MSESDGVVLWNKFDELCGVGDFQLADSLYSIYPWRPSLTRDPWQHFYYGEHPWDIQRPLRFYQTEFISAPDRRER